MKDIKALYFRGPFVRSGEMVILDKIILPSVFMRHGRRWVVIL